MGIFHVDLHQKNPKFIHVGHIIEAFLDIFRIQVVISQAEIQDARGRTHLVIGHDVAVLVGYAGDVLQYGIPSLFRVDNDRIFRGTSGARRRRGN